ncbi:mucin-2-like [Mytilus trossulus]|uniref:mucin-2-like n=1 Tax=Mytilus trossulus TaxID=6551 RepID=UPI0030063839
MSSKSRKATKKVPGFVALHLTDNDSSAISPVFRLLGNAAYYINNNNSSPKAKVILCGKVRDALIIKFSDNKAELKSAIDKYFGRDDDKPNPPPAKKKKTVCTKEKTEKKKTNILATTAPPKSVSSTNSVKSAKYLASEEVMKQVMSFTSSSEEMSLENSPPEQTLSSHIQPTPSSIPVFTHSTSHYQSSTPSDIQPAILLKTHFQSAISPESVLSTEANHDILSLSPPLSVPSTHPTSTQPSRHASVQAVLSPPLSSSTHPTSTQPSPHASVQAVLSPPLSVPSTQPTSTQPSPHASVQAVLSPPLSVPSTQPTSTQPSPHASVQAVSQSSFQSATPCYYDSTHSAMYSKPFIQPDIPKSLINPISDIKSTFLSQSTTFHTPESIQSSTFSTQQIFVAEPLVPMLELENTTTQSSLSSARQGTSFTDDPTDILSNSNVQHIIASPESARLLQSIMKDNINTTPSCQMEHHCSCLDRIEKTMNEVLKVLISMQSLNPVQISVVDVMTSNTDSIHPQLFSAAPTSTETDPVITALQSSIESCIPEPLPRYTTEISSSTLPSTITKVRNPKPSLPSATSSNILSTSSARDILAELNCQSNIPDKEPISPIALNIRTPVIDPQFLSLSLTTILQNKPSCVKTNLHLFQPAPTISPFNQIPDNHLQDAKISAGDSSRRFAVNLFRNICSVDDVLNKNVKGKVFQGKASIKGQISSEKINAIRLACQTHYPSLPSLAEKNWSVVVRAIDKANWNFHQHLRKSFDLTDLNI